MTPQNFLFVHVVCMLGDEFYLSMAVRGRIPAQRVLTKLTSVALDNLVGSARLPESTYKIWKKSKPKIRF